ncbi:MAG: hypothetical protein KIB47_00615 [Clostridium sp.]|nr:hypothetical protein [Clostridium sp.]
MKSKKLTICLGTIIAILSLASCGKENNSSTSPSSPSSPTDRPSTPSTPKPSSPKDSTTPSSKEEDPITSFDEVKEKVIALKNTEATSFKMTINSNNSITTYTSEIRANEYLRTKENSTSKEVLFDGYYENFGVAYDLDITQQSGDSSLSGYGAKYTLGDTVDINNQIITKDYFITSKIESKKNYYYDFNKAINNYLTDKFESQDVTLSSFDVMDAKNKIYLFNAYSEVSYFNNYSYTFQIAFTSDWSLKELTISEKKANEDNWDKETHTPSGTYTTTLTTITDIANDPLEISSFIPTILGKNVDDYYLKEGCIHDGDVKIVNRKGSTNIAAGDVLNVELDDSIFYLGASNLEIKTSSNTSIINKTEEGWVALAKGTCDVTIGTALYPNLLTISVTVLDASEAPASVDYFEGMVTGSSYLDEYGTTISIPSKTGLNQKFELIAGSSSSTSTVYGPFESSFVSSLTVGAFNMMDYTMSTTPYDSGFSFSFTEETSTKNTGKTAIFMNVNITQSVADGTYNFGITQTGFTSQTTPLGTFSIIIGSSN